MSSLAGRIACVTGAGRGIGRASAIALAKAGADVALMARTLSQLEAVAAEIRSLGRRVIAISVDVSREDAVEKAFAAMDAGLGPVDILLNNAGVVAREPFLHHSTAVWRHVMGVNLDGAFYCARAAFQRMQGRGGSIINVSSLGGLRRTEKFPAYAAYTVSKFAMVGLTEALQAEGQALGIRVNAIAPGAVNTDMLRTADPSLKALVGPDEVAKLVLFLADETNSGYLRGTVIDIQSNG